MRHTGMDAIRTVRVGGEWCLFLYAKSRRNFSATRKMLVGQIRIHLVHDMIRHAHQFKVQRRLVVLYITTVSLLYQPAWDVVDLRRIMKTTVETTVQ